MKYYKTHASADAGNRYKTYCVRQRVRERGVDFASHENFFTHWQLWNTICIVNCERGRERESYKNSLCIYLPSAARRRLLPFKFARRRNHISVSTPRSHTSHGKFFVKVAESRIPSEQAIHRTADFGHCSSIFPLALQSAALDGQLIYVLTHNLRTAGNNFGACNEFCPCANMLMIANGAGRRSEKQIRRDFCCDGKFGPDNALFLN